MFVSYVKTEHLKYLRCKFYKKMLNQILIFFALDQEDIIVKINYLAYFSNVSLPMLLWHLAIEIMEIVSKQVLIMKLKHATWQWRSCPWGVPVKSCFYGLPGPRTSRGGSVVDPPPPPPDAIPSLSVPRGIKYSKSEVLQIDLYFIQTFQFSLVGRVWSKAMLTKPLSLLSVTFLHKTMLPPPPPPVPSFPVPRGIKYSKSEVLQIDLYFIQTFQFSLVGRVWSKEMLT